MAKKKKKNILDIDLSGLETISSTLSNLTEQLSKDIEPLNFNNLEEQINNLKKSVKHTTKVKNETEGETCMHDNSWHSNCSDCEELNSIDDLFTLVENTPNDKELGKKIRQIYWASMNSDADSGDEPTDNQLNLFD